MRSKTGVTCAQRRTEFDRLDKCVSALALPVSTISPDKGRAIGPKNQSIRNGRVLTCTDEGGHLDSHENHDHGTRSSLLLREQRPGFMAGINLRDEISE